MTQAPQDQNPPHGTDPGESLWVLVIDDDRLSSHSLSILLRFVGETPILATSDSWAESMRMLGGGQSQLLAAAFGQVKKVPFADALMAVHSAAPALPLLLLGGSDSELDEALPQKQLAKLPESLRAKLLTPGEGALNNQRLLGVLNQARRLSGRAENLLPSVLSSNTGAPLFRSLSGQSAPIAKVKQLMLQVASRPTSVLVRGESGTGKEVVARNLHYHSGRKGKPFIAVNCATITPDQNGVELFGQEKNGHDARAGYIEKADGGTLFLDEIGELPLNIQATLLRFLEDKQFQRQGGHDVLSADVRIVAGTRQNLEARMREGKFREDLYYRLSVVPIELPPLRQRSEDIPELIKELISSLENRDQTSVRFNSQALQSLQKHSWPGNVRELANLVERLGIMQPNAVLGVGDLPPDYQYPVSAEEAAQEEEEAPQPGVLTLVQNKPVAVTDDSGAMLPLNEARLQQYLDSFEKQLIEVALDDSAGLLDFAADRLQLDPSSLRAMMQAHGIRERAPR